MNTPRQQAVFKSVKNLYAGSNREIGKWMWDNHVQWVANKAVQLAGKHGANEDKVYAGALLHDLGDVWMERDEAEFEKKGKDEGSRILLGAGFDEIEAKEIFTEIIGPHSCHPGNLPITLEGKCLATADAMFHLMTDFFPQFGWKHLPKSKNYNEWTAWVNEKLDRDFNNKIFFEDQKIEVEPYYLALKQVYTGLKRE